MHLGIFAKTFPRPTIEETLDAIADRGLTHVQFNMSCAGLPTLAERIDEDFCRSIAQAFRERGLTMAAISGTFNLCDPDPLRLLENLKRLELLAAACRWLDTRIVTLCTGTRDPEDMWRWHPENVRRTTWDSLTGSIRLAVQIADRHEVTLAFEPEIGNVVNSVSKARRLLDEIGSPWLKVVIDPANLMRTGDFPRMKEILEESFDWLGPDIVLAHAKNPPNERNPEERLTIREYLDRQSANAWFLDTIVRKLDEAARRIPREVEKMLSSTIPRCLVDLQEFYDEYIQDMRRIGYTGALVIHGLSESELGPIQSLLEGELRRPGQGR
ncbi:MAG: sugar phosphate isomerase/epimerase family protein [Isosphaeraceae bacterium]